MNAEEILTEVYWNLSTLDCDQIKYPDHDTLIKQLKKYMNSRYGIIIAKEGKMAGFLNEQVQEWYKNNTDLLGVIEKLTNRCKKLEEENDHLNDENKILKDEFDIKVKVVKEQNDRLESLGRNLCFLKSTITDLNGCIAEKRVRNRELKKKLDAEAKNYENLQITHNNLVDRYEELQASYDNCVNECSDHVIEIDSLLKNLEVETVEKALDKIKLLKDGCLITLNFSAEADLRMENEKLRKKIEDLRKDVKFEFDHRMEVLAASTDQAVKMALLKQENARLKNFIKDRTKEIHEMSEDIEKCLAKYREEKNHD